MAAGVSTSRESAMRRRQRPSLGGVDEFIGAPKGIRTPVFAVKGRRPRPLDDGRGSFAGIGGEAG